MISIGWIPVYSYHFFSVLKSKFPALKSIPNMKLNDQYLNPGTQGYIVKNSTMKNNYIEFLFQPTLQEFYEKIITHPDVIKNCKLFNKNIHDIDEFIVIDCYLHYILNPLTLFPPIVIEGSIESSLGHNNIENYWSVFFKNYAIEKTNYFTDEYMEPLLLSYCNDNTHSNTQTFITTLDRHSWNYHILGHGEPWINFVESRMKSYLHCLKGINPKQIVVLSDARDVFCVRNHTHFIRDFKKYNKKIVVSMELFAEGFMTYDPNKSYEQVVWIENYWKMYNIDYSKVIRKFVNGGLICGYVEDLIKCYQWIIDNNYEDDQKGLGAYVNTFPDIIYADINADLLHTSGAFVGAGYIDKDIQNQDSVTFLELTGVKPFFVHIPGLQFISSQRFVYNKIKKTLDSLNQLKKIELFAPHCRKNLL